MTDDIVTPRGDPLCAFRAAIPFETAGSGGEARADRPAGRSSYRTLLPSCLGSRSGCSGGLRAAPRVRADDFALA